MENAVKSVKVFFMSSDWKILGSNMKSARRTNTGDGLVLIQKVCANPDSDIAELRQHCPLEDTKLIE